MPRAIHVQQGRGLRRRRAADTNRPSAYYPAIRAAARATLRRAGITDAELSVTLLDDEAIADLNRRFLDHDRPTDVIAFGLYEQGEEPVGDIYIGLEQALRQAAEAGEPPARELARLAIHGTLHVLGHEHPAGAARTRSPMWRLQEQILDSLGSA